MSEFQLNLVQSELKIILEALIEKESLMADICETSDDADEIADIGNDLIDLRLLLKPLKERALAAFGSGILNFGRDPL
jgi:hypothetical protein